MSDYGRSLLGAAIALRTALERTGNALATPRLAALLESEAGLAAALAVLPHFDGPSGADRDRVLHELALARNELNRCRCLGTALSSTVREALGDPEHACDYGPNGRQVVDAATRPPGRLQTRG